MAAATRVAALRAAARAAGASRTELVARASAAWLGFRGRLDRARKRVASRRSRRASLVRHILALQLAVTAVIGGLALASLSWTSQAVIRNNLAHWAEQWRSQLNELGAPFYVADETAAMLDVERFVATYPEVAYVTWYERDGSPLFSVAQEGRPERAAAELPASTTADLAALADTSTPHRLDENFDGSGRFRLIGPIWTESIRGDNLPDFSAAETAPTEIELLGFVGVELDFSWYHEQLRARLGLGSLFLLGVLGASWVAVRGLLMRALKPLSELEQPLAELAEGNMEVEFAPSRHAEIQDIVATLEQTTAALRQRDARLVHLATHDTLTGLHNRHRFSELLEAEIERLGGTGGGSALLFIDLDQFKYVNDTSGHPAGDELLRTAARCIRDATRADDVVARFGGDEFTVLARDVTRAQAREIGSNVLEHMRRVNPAHGADVFHLQCSIGVAMVQAGKLTPEELLAQADIACHTAKARGRNRVEVYRVSDKENQQMAKEIGWAQTVRRALENDSFVLHYQPLVNLATHGADHYEVLLRLESESGRQIGPDAFLPAAMRFGLMPDIDFWVVEHALEALSRYRVDWSELRFSINLSAAVFDDGSFAERVKALIERFAVPPDAVVFEITEQAGVEFVTRVDKQFAMLRDLGCGFAIDDFGKGYSSFSYLKQLPVDYLKIDSSFIEQVEHDTMDQTMVRVLGEIARAAGIETVAEGVENRAQLDCLGELGIDYAQGFYLGRPAPAPATPTRRAGRRRRSSAP